MFVLALDNTSRLISLELRDREHNRDGRRRNYTFEYADGIGRCTMVRRSTRRDVDLLLRILINKVPTATYQAESVRLQQLVVLLDGIAHWRTSGSCFVSTATSKSLSFNTPSLHARFVKVSSAYLFATER